MMNSQHTDRCPRCGEGRLRGWDELSEEEQEVARRLPASADYAPGGRQSTHRWCMNCWYETTEDAPRET
ncbi:MAG: hypothetical protein H0X14_06555 [Acidobacteria bacterium]|nr:hypothetical protein [Acidobacteriota bacterium]